MKSLVIFALSFITINSLYNKQSKVVELTTQNFDKLVLQSNQPWLIEFYAPWCGHCKSLAPEFEKVAQHTSGIIQIGAIDMDQHQSLGQPYGIKGFPTLKFFGNDKKKPLDYQGQRTANDITTYLLQQVQAMVKSRQSGQSSNKSNNNNNNSNNNNNNDSEVVVLTNDNFDSIVTNSDKAFIIEFYAPWCGHCKQLEPEWNKLPSKLKSQSISVGKVDCTVEEQIASRFGVQGYPTIIFFKGKVSKKYEGGRDGDSIAQFAQQENEKYLQPKFEQLSQESQLNSLCKTSKGLCIISLLPHIYDSSKEQRDQYLATLQSMAAQYKSRPLQFLWAQAGDFLLLEEQLNLGSGYPTLLSISFDKKLYSVMKGAFQTNNIQQFILRNLAGKEAFLTLSTLKPIPNAQLWDGKDAQLQQHLEEDL